MRIVQAKATLETLPLTEPFRSAHGVRSEVGAVLVQLVTDSGHEGWGCASPVTSATGERIEATARALRDAAPNWIGKDSAWCLEQLREGRSPLDLDDEFAESDQSFLDTPAAAAGLDMAAYNLAARVRGKPLVEMLGRQHTRLPACITLGMDSTETTVESALHWVGQGVRRLKLKIGTRPAEDLRHLRAVSQAVGSRVELAVDANQAYEPEDLVEFLDGAGEFDLLWLEQPMEPRFDEKLRELPSDWRSRIVADESLTTAASLRKWLHPEPPCGLVNLKLMKFGGIAACRRAARLADAAGVGVVWGCTGESRIGIAAALHAAYADKATRFIDLDGHIGLKRDLAQGGFRLEGGDWVLEDRPGLGLRFSR